MEFDLLIINGLISFIVSLAVSILAGRFYGPRWVEKWRNRREHSVKLKDEVLKPWLTKIEEYCKIDAIYSSNADKMVSVEPKDPTDLEFFDVTKSHLESKYFDILKEWEELKRVTLEHNKELANLLEEIRTLTIKEFKMPCYYSHLPGEAPEEHITPDRFAKNIYLEMEFRVRTERKWMIGEPNIVPVIYRDEKFYELAWGGYRLVKSRDKEEAGRTLPLINYLIEMSRFREKVKNLIKGEDEIYKIKRENFEAKIKDVIKSIELSNILKGKCRFCP